MRREIEGTRGNERRRGPAYDDEGIVLRSYKLGESDKILRVFTRGHGKRSAVAKGVRKTTSRFGARLEPLTRARLLMHEGRNMDTVRQAEILTSFSELREDLERFVRAQAMAELIDSVTEEHQVHPELYDLMLEGLELLAESVSDARAAFVQAFFEFKVLACEGFELRVTACAGCGSAVGQGDMTFSLQLGGFLCDACRGRGVPGAGKLIRVGGGTAATLGWMASHEFGEWPSGGGAEPDRELGLIMEKVLEHWMEKEFRTHRVMRSIPGGAATERREVE